MKSPDKNNEIPEMNLGDNYSVKKPGVPEGQDKVKRNIESSKKDLEKLKNFIVKKFSYVESISVLPPQAINFFVEEEELGVIGREVDKNTLEKIKKKVHLHLIVPDEKSKEIPKLKKEIVKQIDSAKQEVWLHVRTPNDVWEMNLDSKFELSSAISMSFPLYDKGILGALRVAEIHKSLVIQKFDKYVVSYVLGGSLVRGEAAKTSDVDVFVIINDTDVKRMPRLELKERLRGMIYQYVAEASHLAGVKNKLEPQIYLLTDFWESVKDAHPVMFTFIRDGVPIYDKGTFMPWKALLKMGKLKPSPEAIDMFMSMGDGVIPRSKKTLLSDIFVNIFWGVTTPAQALLMLNGCPPPNAKKELYRDFKREFYDTKMIEKKYLDFLDKVVKTWRDYEHEKIKEISGKEIDKLLKDTEDYLKRLKELRKAIEKNTNQKMIEQLYKDSISLLKGITGKKSQEEIVKRFDSDFVKKGLFAPASLKHLKNIISAKTEFKKGKLSPHKVDNARKDAEILINDLVEYNQRKELSKLNK